MALTRQGKAWLAAAGLLLAAMEEQAAAPVTLAGPGGAGAAAPGGAGGAGQTIAQQAAAAGKLGPGAGHIPPKKVASAKGVAHYHLPISSLIIPHKPQVAPGAAAEAAQDAAQAAKDKAGEAKYAQEKQASAAEAAQDAAQAAKDQGGGHQAGHDDAAKAVEAGTHKWVQAGPHAVAAHKSVEVHVPKDTDIHDAGAVKNAPKVLVHHGGEPEHVQLHPEKGLGPAYIHYDFSAKKLAQDYKKLPEETPKKAVQFSGQHAAWVPHDWQVHKSSTVPENKLIGKFAKDPAGDWHFIGKNGTVKDYPGAAALELNGAIVPEDQAHQVHPGHVTPNQGAEGPEQPKVDVGGVAVTKDQIQDALHILGEAKSTNVKGPLKAKGNPLWEMDYLGVAGQELQQFPELNVSAGTKKQHVGKVKLAVLHHLAGKLDLLAKNEAEEKAKAHVTAKAEADAAHAQLLTPAAKEWGGKEATAEQLAQAAQWLDDTMGGKQSFKQAMAKAGNPLAGADYMGAAKAYAQAHPNTAKGWSTKKLMLESIKELQAAAEAQDAETGHAGAADLHAKLAGGKVDWAKAAESADGAVAQALVQAAHNNAPYYAFLSDHTPGVWVVKGSWPPNTGKAYMQVTPDHHVTVHTSGGSEHEYDAGHIADILDQWVKPEAAAPEEPPAPAPVPEEEPEPAAPASYLDLPAPLTAAQKAALKKYTAPEIAAAINHSLRTGAPLSFDGLTAGTSPPAPDVIQQIESAMAPVKHPVVMWRGLLLPPGTEAVPGVPLTDKGFTSLTFDKEFAQGWLDSGVLEAKNLYGTTVVPHLARVEVPAGTLAAPGSAYAQELVLQHGTVFQVGEPAADGTWNLAVTGPAPPEPEPPAPELPEAAAGAQQDLAAKTGQAAQSPQQLAAAWQNEPEWQQIHDIIGKAKAGPVYALPNGTDSALAKSLWISGKLGMHRWLYADEHGSWVLGAHEPPAGTWGKQSSSGYYHVFYDHRIVHTDKEGSEFQLPPEAVLDIAQKLLQKPPAEEKPAEPGFDVTAAGNTYHAPAGSKVYVFPSHPDLKPGMGHADVKYVKEPDGTWTVVQKQAPGFGITQVEPGIGKSFDKDLAAGALVPWPPEASPEEAQGKVPVAWTNLVQYWAPPGTTLWYDAGEPSPADDVATHVYLKYPGGYWDVMTGHDEVPSPSANSTETLNAGIVSGQLKPYGKEAEEFAKAAMAQKTAGEPPAPASPEAPAAEVLPDIPVMVQGKEAGKAPAGSKVYWYQAAGMAAGQVSGKYVKYPDGSWWVYGVSGGKSPGLPAGYDSYISKGAFAEELPAKAQAPEKPAAPEPEQPAGEPVPVIHNGAVVGTAPAGSLVYKINNSTAVKKPDGTWAKADSSGVSDMAGLGYDSYVKSGKLKAVPPPSPAELAKATEIGKVKDLLSTGAVTAKDGQKGALSAVAFQLAARSPAYWNGYTGLSVYQVPGNGHWAQGYPGGGGDYWKVDPNLLTVQHVIPPGPGHEDQLVEDVPWEQVKAAIEQVVQPGSVLLGNGEVYKHGYYYNPKGKAYLEIKPAPNAYAYGPQDKAGYLWHQVSGAVKEVTADFAAKTLEKNTEYHLQPKPFEAAVPKKAAYATPAVPGTYHLYSVTEADGLAKDYIEMHGDGSGLYHVAAGDHEYALDTIDGLLGTGTVLDQYGNTAVKPGIKPVIYHLFGSSGKTAEQLTELRDKLQETAGPGTSWHQPFFDFIGSPVMAYPGKDLIKAFLNGKLSGPVNGEAQRAALIGLLSELLLIPAQPSGTDLSGGAEPKFLKSLPEGIHAPKDVFTWTDHGYAVPFPGSLIDFSLDSGQVSEKIKAVSATFGNGQVVGTHLSGLTKPEKQAWLAAWKAGDMAAVFALDAKSGKVSPVHPGAPDNAATHHITWAPWDPSQVPASQGIAGAWTPLDVVPPKAEVDNYLIKVGVGHAAYLSPAERRALVKAHRQHDQDKVDELSRTADTRFHSGDQPLSEPPAWTEDVKPAKSYDVYLEDGTPAVSWTGKAQADFVIDHKEQLQEYALQVAQENWGDTDTEYVLDSYKHSAIQRYLDAKAAKELAEKLRPRYELVPAGEGQPARVADQFGHVYLWHSGSPQETGRRLGVYALARAWGFKHPRVQAAKLESDGTPGVITDIVTPTDGTLAYLPAGVAGLADRELADLAREHVFDHAIGNPSSTPGEYLRAAGDIIATGKDAAFSDFTWDGMSLAHMNDVTVQPAHALFQAIASGEFAKAQADLAYAAAVRAARKMALIGDSRLAAILNDAGVPVSQQVDAFSRISSLPADVQKLWGQVYAGKGWVPPEVPQVRLPHGLYSGFSDPGFFDHVLAAKASGVPAFFAGEHLEKASFLVWTEKAGDNRYLRGESGLRGEALAKAITWAEAHQTGGEAAPSGQPEPVKNAASWHAKVLAAAKAVSRHAADQLWDGPVTKGALQAMADLKAELTSLLAKAEKYAADPSFLNVPAWTQEFGHPYLVKHAAQFYLDRIAQVELAKAHGHTFKPGDIPEWEAPPVPGKDEPKPQPGLKVEYLKATRVLAKAQSHSGASVKGDIVDAQGELQLGSGIYEYLGYAWHVTLPTGEVIEVNDEGKTSTPLGERGRVRFRAIASDGSASLERIRSQLQDMGVPLEEAAPEDMELFYWRHLAYVLAERKDRADGKHALVWKALTESGYKAASEQKKVTALIAAGLHPHEEIAVWRKAWASLTSEQQVAEWAEKGGYLPHIPHLHVAGAEVPAGRPRWYRFDADPHWLAQQQLPTHSLSDTGDVPYYIATTGALYSTEARLRAEGVWLPGASSATDIQTHGSGGVVYTRRTQENTFSQHVWISPRVLAQTTTYGFDHDGWGDLAKRGSHSYFSLASAQSYNKYETDVEDAVSLLDDIMLLRVPDGSARAKVIKALKDRGITEIRGLPVEDRVVSSVTPQVLEKAKKAEPDPSTWFTHPEDTWTPPHAGMAAGETSLVESEAESAVSHASAADALKNAAYSADHSAAPAPEAVSQVFYHSPAKPPPSAVTSQAPLHKHAVAAKLAAAMTSSDAQVEALSQAAGLQAPDHWGDTPRARTAAALIATWSQSNSSPIALALQNAAHKMFGVPKPALPPLDSAGASAEAAAGALESGHAAVLADFLDAQWHQTQAELAAGDLTSLTLYRVFHFADVPAWAKNVTPGQVVPAPQARPLSSWAFTQQAAETAGTFASGGKTVVVRATVPASAILAFPRTGWGCYNEAEFVVLDMNGEWQIVKVQG